MTWGGGFTYGDLIKVAEENNISDCSCVNHIKRKKLLSEVYHGDDIRECKSCTLINARKLMTYPHKLSKLLDAELIDLSKPGESCQYVVRTTIEFFIDRLDEDLSDYIVLLQMPIGLRFEWWKEEQGKADWSGLIIADSDKKEIIEFFGNHMYECYNTLNNIMQVGSFLKENNIAFISNDFIAEFCGLSHTKLLSLTIKMYNFPIFWTYYNLFLCIMSHGMKV